MTCGDAPPVTNDELIVTERVEYIQRAPVTYAAPPVTYIAVTVAEYIQPQVEYIEPAPVTRDAPPVTNAELVVTERIEYIQRAPVTYAAPPVTQIKADIAEFRVSFHVCSWSARNKTSCHASTHVSGRVCDVVAIRFSWMEGIV